MAEPADIVLAAVHAAGPVAGNQRAWRQRVTELVPTIAALLDPTNYGLPIIADNVVNSSGSFPAEFVEYEMEESSKRALITVRTKPSKDYPEGLEPLRSYPAWSSTGYQQIQRIKSLTKGDRLYVHRFNEKMEAGREVRVLAHFEVLGQASSQGSSSPAPPAELGDAVPAASTHTEGVDASAPPTPVQPPPGSQGRAAVEESMKGLANSLKVKVARNCLKAGITNFVDPEDEQLDKVLLIIQEVRNASV